MHTLQNCPFTNCEEVSALYQQRQGQFQRRDQLAPAYNQGWQNHPGFRWGGGNQGGASSSDNYQQRPTSNAIVPTEQKSGPSGNTDTQLLLKAIQESKMATSSEIKEMKGEMGNMRGEMGNMRGDMGNMTYNINALFQENQA